MYRLREHHDIGIDQFAASTAHLLYSKRFQPYYVSPVVCGLRENGEPVLCSYDSIGSPEFSKFVCEGTAANELMGVCDSFYRENMNAEELLECIGQCIFAGENRDAFSGWGIEVMLLTKDKFTTYEIRPRQD